MPDATPKAVVNAEPMLISAARRMAETHPQLRIRIVGGVGTTVDEFVRELDDWLALDRARALERATALVSSVAQVIHNRTDEAEGDPHVVSVTEAYRIVAHTLDEIAAHLANQGGAE